MTAVRFERRGDRYAIRFTYDWTIVALIKTVPTYARSWHPASKTWFVDATYAKQLARDMAAIGFLITGIESADGDLSDWARTLFRRVGPAGGGPVFRSLSKGSASRHGDR